MAVMTMGLDLAGCPYVGPIEGRGPNDPPFIDHTDPLEQEITVVAPFRFEAIVSPESSENPVVTWWMRSPTARRYGICDEKALVLPKELTVLPSSDFTVDPVTRLAGECDLFASGSWSLRVVVADAAVQFDVNRLSENEELSEYAAAEWPLEIQTQ